MKKKKASLRHLIKLISILFISILFSCESGFIKRSLQTFASDGIKEVPIDQVCYKEKQGYFFVKRCGDEYYTAAVNALDVRNKTYAFEYESIRVFILANPKHFIEFMDVIRSFEPKLNNITVGFEDYPKHIKVVHGNYCKRYYKKKNKWILKDNCPNFY